MARRKLTERPITVRVPADLVDRIDAEAEAAGLSRQALARSWLTQRLTEIELDRAERQERARARATEAAGW
jgi:predicted DNA binding CopG/RHH family protein